MVPFRGTANKDLKKIARAIGLSLYLPKASKITQESSTWYDSNTIKNATVYENNYKISLANFINFAKFEGEYSVMNEAIVLWGSESSSPKTQCGQIISMNAIYAEMNLPTRFQYGGSRPCYSCWEPDTLTLPQALIDKVRGN